MKVDTLNMGTHTPLLWCQHHVHALIFITNRVQRRFSLCNRKKGTNYSAVFYGCWLGPAQSTYTLSLSRIINPVPRGRLGAILSRMFAHRQFLLQQVNISLGCSNCCKYLYFVLYSFLSVYIWNILCSILTVCQTAPVFFLTRSHYEPIIVRDNSVESKKWRNRTTKNAIQNSAICPGAIGLALSPVWEWFHAEWCGKLFFFLFWLDWLIEGRYKDEKK